MYRVLFLLLLVTSAAVRVFAGREFTPGVNERIVTDELLVKLKPGTNSASLFSAVAPAAVIKLLNQNLGVYQLRVPPGLQKLVAAQLAAHNLTDYVEPNHVRKLTISAPDDTSYTTEQYGLNAIHALQAWDILPDRYLTSGSANTARLKVAVIDTGADCNHPDFMNLGGFSTNSALGGQLLWSSSEAIVPTSIANPACSWLDDHGHGTHVAGIVAAATNNNRGVASLGYALQVIVYRAVGTDGTGIDSNIAAAIASATDAGASVISMSFGAPGYSQTIQTALNYAWQHNVVVVAAAGNDSAAEPFFPAGGAHVVGISATDNTNQRAAFSNFGPIVSIAAPGNLIYSTVPTYAGTTLGFLNYTRLSGTSMATPHVSALAGLINLSSPGIASDAVIQRMQQSANSSAANGGWEQNLGYGIIDARAALNGTLRSATVGGIRGQVVDANGIAVSGVVVSVASTNVTTDQSGFFRFFNLVVGPYSISATGGGFPTQTLSVGVAPGADTPVTFRMGVQLATFTGRVMNGVAGVGGAVVQALAGGLVQSSAIAAPDGNYSLAVTPGTYDLKASSPSSIAAIVSGRTVTLGTPVTVNFTLPRMGTIAGTIVDAFGAPIPNVQVSFTAPNLSSGATTNASGQYTSIGLTSGLYNLTATAPGQQPRIVNDVVVSPDTVITVNLTIGNRAPTTVSVTPSSGSGLTQSFALAYSDPDGFADLSSTQVIINAGLDSGNACYIIYYRAANVMYLLSNDGQSLIGPLTPGVAGTVQNSQCTLAGTGSSVSASGITLTLTAALTFKAGFSGVKNIYMSAQDVAGTSSVWTSRGTWTLGTVVNSPPTTISVTPNSGTGLTQSFAFVYSDPNGFADLAATYVIINAGLDSRNGCYIAYYRGPNVLYLLTDDGQALLGPLTPGAAGNVQNTQCILAGTGSSVSGSGNNLTLTTALTFKTGFNGVKNIYMSAQDSAGLSAAWTSRGTWTPGTVINSPPTTISVTPNSGTGLTQSFAFVYSDPNGFADLATTYVIINAGLDSRNGCYIAYYRGPNVLYLLTDDGQALLGPLTPGAAGNVQNTQCILAGTGSSVSGSGNNLTLTTALTFKTGFSGVKNIYMSAQDSAGLSAAWTSLGTWTPGTSTNRAPTTVSVVPNTGSGVNATFTLTYSDPDGFADLNPVYALINGALDSSNACYVLYYPGSNSLYLVNDNSTALLGPVNPGTAGTAQNSQCSVNSASSSASGSGSNLVFTLALSFKPAFTGSKSVFMNALDVAGATSGFTSRGTWTVP
jgi:subtilisin family serine protease